MGGERLALFVEARDNESLDVGHFGIGWAWWLGDILGGGRKEKEVNRLHKAIVPYITENLRPYVTRPPVRSCGDWGQSQFQLGGDDESTHQIPSNGLLFSTFYHFPYTTDPPTSTVPTGPSPTFAQTFVRSPPTIPDTHHTIGPVPHRRPLI